MRRRSRGREVRRRGRARWRGSRWRSSRCGVRRVVGAPGCTSLTCRERGCTSLTRGQGRCGQRSCGRWRCGRGASRERGGNRGRRVGSRARFGVRTDGVAGRGGSVAGRFNRVCGRTNRVDRSVCLAFVAFFVKWIPHQEDLSMLSHYVCFCVPLPVKRPNVRSH